MASNSTEPKSPAQAATEIGWAFVPQYYNFVNKDPSRLHCFYTKQSTLIHSNEGDEATPCYGQQEIHQKFMSVGFDDCKVFVSTVDSQSSADNGIIVQVLGEMSNANKPWRRFAQTFFLAEQPNGFFVLNDIFRYLKDETEEPEEEEAAVAEETEDVAALDSHDSAATAAPVTLPEAHVSSELVPPNNDTEVVTEDATASTPEPPAEAEAPQTNGYHEPPPKVPEITLVPDEPTQTAQGAQTLAAAEPAAPSVSSAEMSGDQSTSADDNVVEPAVQANPEASLPTTQEASTSARAPVPVQPPPPYTLTEPAAPPAPKTWATLAASGKAKWSGNLSASQGVSSAPPPQASQSSAERSGPPNSSISIGPTSGAGERRPRDNDRYPPIESITTGSCFIKGVNENVDDKVLRDTLVRQFGPVKELDIVRSKACAFLEFERADSARKAIQMSMPYSLGGGGGISVGLDNHIINIEVKRQPGERGRPADAGPKRGLGGDRGRGYSGRGRTGDGERGSMRGGRGRGGVGRGTPPK